MDVFFDQQSNMFHMVFCAKTPYNENNSLTGCIGHAVSKDLINWKLLKPLWTPGIGYCLECPQLTKLDTKYALIYYWHDTNIRIANSLSGKFKKTSIEDVNGFDYMSAKTLNDGKRIISFGFIPDKDCDCKKRTWGGTLAIPRKIYLKNNAVYSKFVDEIYDFFKSDSKKANFNNIVDVNKNVTTYQNNIACLPKDKSSLVVFNECDDNYYLKTNLKVSNKNAKVTFLIRTNKDDSRNYKTSIDEGYQIIIDFAKRILSIREHYMFDQRPDLATIPLFVKNSSVLLEVVVDKDIIEIAIDKKYSMVYRMLKHTKSGSLAILVQDSKVVLEDFVIKEINDN